LRSPEITSTDCIVSGERCPSIPRSEREVYFTSAFTVAFCSTKYSVRWLPIKPPPPVRKIVLLPTSI